MYEITPAPLPARYARACLLLGVVLVATIPPCLMVGFLAPSLPELGMLRWVVLAAPAAVAGSLALVATYYLNHASRVSSLRPSPSRLAGGALAVFALGALTLALPAALFTAVPDGTLLRPLPPDDARLEVLRQRALRHGDARVRAASARTLYLASGQVISYRDASRRLVEFTPSAADRRTVTLRAWMASRPGARPRERRLLAGLAVIMVSVMLVGLPLAAALGRQRRRPAEL